MNNKLYFDICTLINFDSSFRERFNKCFRIRNYYIDQPDIYFEFSFVPSDEMVCFIKEYVDSIGGYVCFSSDMRRFEIFSKFM